MAQSKINTVYFWRERCQQLQARIAEQVQEIKEKTQQLEDADNHARFIERERKALKQELKDIKLEMETEQNKTSALARIGADIRIRFLEKAKTKVVGLNPANLDAKFIQRGNDAAHRAYGAVDAALLTGNFLEDEEKARLKAVFPLIYDGLAPQNYSKMPARMLQAIDYQGSVVSLYAQNNGSMIKDKQAAADSMNFIKDKYLELEDDVFEEDEGVAHHLKRLREFADLIITKARRYDASSATPSTTYGPPQTLTPLDKPVIAPKFYHGRRPPRGNK
ncbi:34c1283d-85dc-4daa-8989-4bf4a86e14a6-CDS [Sclerotinia trifoliorum]|uniref:34c1283d-85dc-4daa-8989-4bf4a86e14a6-CDS n=1 Tax=Sclerotinia trifoliorum TaxID=28548 RepID=A0A8H2W3Z5_9HELO|nr:34c1283d-85dc-4daa-8989-4bf4a86e14a6-CDS [Sclerotinia trifoliorum]